MKFNWATGLVIFFTLFIGTLIFVVYQSRQYENSLVMDNYYEEDLKYQAHFDKKQNTENLTTKVKVEYNSSEKKVILTFPIDSISATKGSILLFNPSSQKADIKYDFDLGKEAIYSIPVEKIKTGRWKVKIDWKLGEKPFYQEEEVII